MVAISPTLMLQPQGGYEVVFHCDLDWHFPNDNEVLHLVLIGHL